MRTKILPSMISMIVIAVCAVILAVVWMMPYLASPDSVQEQAALFALNHTPIDHVQKVEEFTGGQLQTVVVGTDAFGRKLYAFMIGRRSVVIYADHAISSRQAIAAVRRAGEPIARILSAVPGLAGSYLPSSAAGIKGSAVWEVTAALQNGDYLFAFVDMATGRFLSQFTTHQQPRL